MILGIHCSVREGLLGALHQAEELGARVLQILPHKRGSLPKDEELASFRAGAAGSRIIVHSRFAPCLASSDGERRARSVARLVLELGLAREEGAEAFVVHAGAYSPGASAGEGIRLMGASLAEAREKSPGAPPVWIENVPGGGRRLGGTIEELAALGEAWPAARFCLDTAHAWAAGYDLSAAEGAWRFAALAHRLLGEERVAAFHLNDTRAMLGSHREHHAAWGEGFLGREGLRHLLERPEYREVLGILEPPRGGERASLDYVSAIRRP